jgi:cyclic pyranopterin phosphate synthase
MSLPIVDEGLLPPGGPLAGRRGRLPAYSLRVSVLEQCQLDCRYCRPGSTTTPTEKARWLGPDEHRRLARTFLARGVRKVRFTGGEPTLRPELPALVQAWRDVAADMSVPVGLALTTNGLRLLPLLPALLDAGLQGVTLHLDSLRADRIESLMGKGADVDIALAAIDAARALGFDVKWNAVVQRGHNDDELTAMLARARDLGVELRFIEQMNTGSAKDYVAATFISGRDIVGLVDAAVGAVAVPRRQPSDPAALYRTDDGVVFGVIASDTEPFCEACDRLRLSADGRVRGCLYQPGGLPLGAALRAGTDDAGLMALLDSALDDKQSHHPLVPRARTPFSMADVGG